MLAEVFLGVSLGRHPSEAIWIKTRDLAGYECLSLKVDVTVDRADNLFFN